MNIDSIRCAQYQAAAPSAGATATQAPGVDPDGDGDGPHGGNGVHGHHGHRGGPGGMMATMMQTLSDLGFAGPPPPQGAADPAGTDGQLVGVGDPHAVRQAMHALMHDIFQAMRASSGSQATAAASSGTSDTSSPTDASLVSTPPTADTTTSSAVETSASTATSSRASRYSVFSDRLQTVVDALTSAPDSAQGSALQTDFLNLMTALGAKPADTSDTASGTTADAPTLAQFLSRFVQNLQARSAEAVASMPATGGLVSVSA